MNNLESEICKVVEMALCENLSVKNLASSITREASMANISEWDSLSFVAVFLSVSEHFKLDVEEDDAIHFQSVQDICNLIEEIRES